MSPSFIHVWIEWLMCLLVKTTLNTKESCDVFALRTFFLTLKRLKKKNEIKGIPYVPVAMNLNYCLKKNCQKVQWNPGEGHKWKPVKQSKQHSNKCTQMWTRTWGDFFFLFPFHPSFRSREIVSWVLLKFIIFSFFLFSPFLFIFLFRILHQFTMEVECCELPQLHWRFTLDVILYELPLMLFRERERGKYARKMLC